MELSTTALQSIQKMMNETEQDSVETSLAPLTAKVTKIEETLDDYGKRLDKLESASQENEAFSVASEIGSSTTKEFIHVSSQSRVSVTMKRGGRKALIGWKPKSS